MCSEIQAAATKIVAYVPNWIDLNAFAAKIDYAKLTHINIAFENPEADGELSFHQQDAALITKAHANHVKVMVSIGGGAASGDKVLLERYGHLLMDTNRAEFVAKIATYVARHDFDGVDVDIEGPSIDANFGVFIHDLSLVLKPEGKLLTAALSQGYGGEKIPNSVFEHLNFVNLMAYDAVGNWDPKSPGQHSSFEFATNNVAYWLGRGLPKDKAVLGVPFYGYGFGKAFRNGDYAYSEIITKYPGAENQDKVGNTIWYNGIPTIRAKCRYAVENNLGGVMIWSLDYDIWDDRSLLSVIHEALKSRMP